MDRRVVEDRSGFGDVWNSSTHSHTPEVPVELRSKGCSSGTLFLSLRSSNRPSTSTLSYLTPVLSLPSVVSYGIVQSRKSSLFLCQDDP